MTHQGLESIGYLLSLAAGYTIAYRGFVTLVGRTLGGAQRLSHHFKASHRHVWHGIP